MTWELAKRNTGTQAVAEKVVKITKNGNPKITEEKNERIL